MMKKIYCYFLFLLTMFSLTACQGSTPDARTYCDMAVPRITHYVLSNVPDITPTLDLHDTTTDVSESSTAEETTPADIVIIEVTDPENVDLTNREIIEGILAGGYYTRMGWPLSAYEWDDHWIVYKPHDGTNDSIEICPENIYPYEFWTPELVLRSYKDKSAPWLRASDPKCSDVVKFAFDEHTEAMLFSQDYNYTFVITKDGWLTINDVMSIPYRCTTLPDIEPSRMAAYYRAGLWDGSRVWSEDYRTSVEFGYGTQLEYTYYDNLPDVEVPYAYTYSGEATRPWWEDQTEYKVDAEYAGPDALVATVYVDDFYPDLPDGKIKGNVRGKLINVRTANSSQSNAISVLTTAGPYYFLKGELLEHWEIPVKSTSGAFLLDNIQYENADHVYFYTGNKFIDLRANGEYEVLYNNIRATMSHECICWFFYIEDGALKCINTDNTEEIKCFDVITDREVTSVTNSGYDVLVRFKGDPNTYQLEQSPQVGGFCVTLPGTDFAGDNPTPADPVTTAPELG